MPRISLAICGLVFLFATTNGLATPTTIIDVHTDEVVLNAYVEEQLTDGTQRIISKSSSGSLLDGTLSISVYSDEPLTRRPEISGLAAVNSEPHIKNYGIESRTSWYPDGTNIGTGALAYASSFNEYIIGAAIEVYDMDAPAADGFIADINEIFAMISLRWVFDVIGDDTSIRFGWNVDEISIRSSLENAIGKDGNVSVVNLTTNQTLISKGESDIFSVDLISGNRYEITASMIDRDVGSIGRRFTLPYPDIIFLFGRGNPDVLVRKAVDVPEPTTGMLLGIGLIALAGVKRRQRTGVQV